MPASVHDVRPILRRMEARGELQAIQHLRHVYEVTVPYARSSPLAEDELLMEVHPYAALSYLSALAFHGLTDELPKGIFAMVPTQELAEMYPAGTTPEDWIGLDLVVGRRPPKLRDRPVQWVRVSPERYFGIYPYQPHGYTVLVTSPERALLDGLQRPELSGGLDTVLQAWSLARDTVNLDALVQLVERFGMNLLRQRAGFLIEELGLSHPALTPWQASAKRGGSSKLLASAPYADVYSERWNLSLNAPIGALTLPHNEG